MSEELTEALKNYKAMHWAWRTAPTALEERIAFQLTQKAEAKLRELGYSPTAKDTL